MARQARAGITGNEFRDLIAAYIHHQYGEHARSEHLLAAGYTMAAQRASGTGVVMLESRIRYLRELTFGEEVEVTSDIEFGTGKAFRIEHVILRADGGQAAVRCPSRLSRARRRGAARRTICRVGARGR